MKRMHGINTPMVTPFDSRGNIDFEALRENVDFLIFHGINNLYPLGTLGEGVLMTVDERKKVAEAVVDHAAGRVGVFIHVGALRQDDAIELAKHAESIGADGIGAVSPFFYGLGQKEIKDYFKAISRSVSDIYPIYLYNLPGMTGNDMLPETVAELAQIPNIVGIKNTMPIDMRLDQLVHICPADFDVISGDDTNAFAGLSVGAKGLVSGTTNAFPELFVAMYKCIRENDLAGAAAKQHMVYEIAGLMKNDYRTCYIKAMMEMRGLRKTYARAPLQKNCTKEEYDRFYNRLKEILADTEIAI